jgi:hypothetical protein
MYVTYYGSSTAWYGKDFEILDESVVGLRKRIAFIADGEIHWRTLGASFSKPFMKKEIKAMPTTTMANPDDDDFSEVLTNFLEPYKTSIEALDAEATRLRERLAEIEVAKRVLKSL